MESRSTDDFRGQAHPRVRPMDSDDNFIAGPANVPALREKESQEPLALNAQSLSASRSTLFESRGHSRAGAASPVPEVPNLPYEYTKEGRGEEPSDVEAQPAAPETTELPPVSENIDSGEGWLVIFGVWIAYFCSFGWVNCIGIFQTYYSSHSLSAYSPSTVAWIPSLEVCIMFFGGAFVGRAFDSYGPRWLLVAGTFFHVFGLMMASLSSQYYQIILSQGICSSIGASLIFYSAMNSASTWFIKKRAAALGIAASGASLGGVVQPIMVQKLIPEIGFPWAMRTIAFMFLGLLTISIFTVRSRLRHKPKRVYVMEFIRPLGQPTFLLVSIGAFLFFFGTFLPFDFLILQAQSKGMSENLASYLIPMLNAASIFGRITPGFVADRYGGFNTMVVTTALSGILALALWLPAASNAPIIVFAITYGFASGAFVTLIPVLVATIVDIKQIGVSLGTAYLLVSLAALTENPIGGALVSREGGKYTWMQIFCGVAMLAGTMVFIAARTSRVGFKLLVKV